ncbi:MAG: DUF4114 domain-containing protein [Candidatus Marinimicrobia bacterium]|nr:DUF4114 domain-containing protein [Candidatus Neomarinimicrobiota bacterium]
MVRKRTIFGHTLFTFIFAFILTQCENPTQNTSQSQDSRVQVTQDKASLSHRVHYSGDVIYPGSSTDGLGKSAEADQGITLELIAEVDPPTMDDQALRASHIRIVGDYALVSYNVEGPTFLGGLDIFNISNPNMPALESQVLFSDTDVNSVYATSDNIVITGGADPYKNTEFQSAAVLEILPFSLDDLSNITRIDLPGYTGTDVHAAGGSVYVTSGDNAGLTVWDQVSNDMVHSAELPDARSVDRNGDQIFVMQGNPASVTALSATDYSANGSYQYSGATYQGAKSILRVNDQYIFIPAGDEGLKVADKSSGELVASADAPDAPEGEPADYYVTNSVAFADDYILLGNGAAGIFILSMNENNELVTHAGFDLNSSANFMDANEDLIFVASGHGGLKILEIVNCTPTENDYEVQGGWDQYGFPDYVLDDKIDISANILTFIEEVLPESNVDLSQFPEIHNQQIDDLDIVQDGSLVATAVFDGAGWKNSLGFYHYADATPECPTMTNALEILFPNFSINENGSKLRPGHSVEIGQLTAGEHLGFFLISKGWKNQTVTPGLYTHYTNTSWNPESDAAKRAHTLLLYDEVSDALIVAMEDVSRESEESDKDFNDAIIIVTGNVAETIDVSGLPTLSDILIQLVD